jgi:predicted AlkP superfamily pyrophosphatase or phosphodiesterase
MRLPYLGAVWLAALLVLAACSTSPPPLAPDSVAGRVSEPDALLLVSIDGLRADYLQLGITPNLSRLSREGVRAEWMTPSYPSLTFPNHYTLVTGLRPDRHGIVQNTMRDPVLGSFSLSNREAVGDGRWWGGEPLWVSAEKAGLRSATLFWPGSEAAIEGVRPTRWLPFDAKMTNAARVDTVLGWLSEPAATRPRFATLYFDQVDHDAHDHGPDSPQAHAAIRAVDSAVGRLLDGLSTRGMRGRVNLVIVSDHGMAAVAPGNTVAVEDMVDAADAEALTFGQSIAFQPLPGRERQAEARLLGKHKRYQCWRKNELPARWHYGRHPRVPAIVCQMHEGWDAGRREWLAKRTPSPMRGSHGYDPDLPSMRAVFIARGPAFREGLVIPAFDNVDVYPLLARLIGIAAAPNDGDPATLLPALKAGE